MPLWVGVAAYTSPSPLLGLVPAESLWLVAGGPSSSAIIADSVIKQLRNMAESKAITAVVLRADSGGGDALAADLVWRNHQVMHVA